MHFTDVLGAKDSSEPHAHGCCLLGLLTIERALTADHEVGPCHQGFAVYLRRREN